MGFAHWFKYKTAKKQLEAEEEQIEADKEKKSPIDKARLAAFEKAKAKRDEDRKLAVDFTEKAVKALDAARTPDSRHARGPPRIPIAAGRNLQRRRGLQARPPRFTSLDRRPSSRTPASRSTKPRCGSSTAPARPACNWATSENAAAVGDKFMDLGPDQAQVNVRIMSFAKGLDTYARRSWGKRRGGSDRAERGRGEVEGRYRSAREDHDQPLQAGEASRRPP